MCLTRGAKNLDIRDVTVIINAVVNSKTKGVEKKVPKVDVRRGEPLDRALRRLKRKLENEGILRELRERRHYEKPSEKRRKKAKRTPNRPRPS